MIMFFLSFFIIVFKYSMSPTLVSVHYFASFFLISFTNRLVLLQMIESSAHGDEYDGVIFSQLVCCIKLILFAEEILFLAPWLIVFPYFSLFF